MNLNLTTDQRAALARAADAAEMSEQDFVLLAIRIVSATYGVVVPDKPVRVAAPPTARTKTGRPRATNNHPMERHVPAGAFAYICQWCKRDFRQDDDDLKFCSEVCERRAQNLRSYGRRKG